MPRPRRKPKTPIFHISVTVHLRPDILSRCLEVVEGLRVPPAASPSAILLAALQELTKDLPYKDEDVAIGHLHSYGIPLSKLLPRRTIQKQAASAKERRAAQIERQRYLLSLDVPPPETDPLMERDLTEKDFYEKLYGFNPTPIPNKEDDPDD